MDDHTVGNMSLGNVAECESMELAVWIWIGTCTNMSPCNTFRKANSSIDLQLQSGKWTAERYDTAGAPSW